MSLPTIKYIPVEKQDNAREMRVTLLIASFPVSWGSFRINLLNWHPKSLSLFLCFCLPVAILEVTAQRPLRIWKQHRNSIMNYILYKELSLQKSQVCLRNKCKFKDPFTCLHQKASSRALTEPNNIFCERGTFPTSSKCSLSYLNYIKGKLEMETSSKIAVSLAFIRN